MVQEKKIAIFVFAAYTAKENRKISVRYTIIFPEELTYVWKEYIVSR